MTTSHWILTATGQDQPIVGAGLLMAGVPQIEVIAHSLAQINRFSGHTSRPYSVAEHSVLVSDIVDMQGHSPLAQLAALMHDAHECLCGDATSPVKWSLGTPWLTLENPLALMVRKQYGLKAAHTSYSKCIKAADLIALATERRDLMQFDPATNWLWPVLDNPCAPVQPLEGVDLNNPVRAAMGWSHHRDVFLGRFRRLCATVNFQPKIHPETLV